MTDTGPSTDDISQLWGDQPDLLTPAPLRHAEAAQAPPSGEAGDAMAVLQGEVRRLQALVAALDPAALRREAGTALETGLAALETRLGIRIDELGRRVERLAGLASARDPGDGEPNGAGQSSGRHRSWRTRREHEETSAAPGRTGAAPSPTTAALPRPDEERPATGVEARSGGRLDDLADLVEGLVRRLPGRSAASDPPAKGQRPVEEVRSPVL